MSGGGGGQQTSTQQTQSSSGPPAFIQPYLQRGIKDLEALYRANPTAPGYFPGSTIAPQSAYTQQAIEALANRGANGSATGNAANSAVTDTLNGKYLDPTTNPSYLAAIEASHKPYLEQFTNQVIPGVTSAFTGSGRTGSGLHQAAVDNATTSLNRTISDADAKAGADYYSTERNRMMTAAGLSPSLANMDYQNIGALGQAGEAKDAYAQAGINENISRYNYDNNKQWDYISRYLGMLNGGYPGSESSGTATATQPQQSSSPWGSIFGGAGLGLQALGMAKYLGVFSDERLKEDIEPVGSLNDGQTVYSYKYKGDPTPRIGLMAQEVEKVRPDAVIEHESGYKMVDYGRATERARGLF